MFALMPNGPVPPVPPPPAPQAQPPKGKPPIALFIVIGTVLLCGVLACVGFGVLSLLPEPTPDGPHSNSGDAEVVAGAEAIARGCELYAADNGSCPPSDQVWSGGELAYYVDEWPDNPFTGQPMAPTGEPGDFIYHTSTSMGYGEEYLGYIEAVLEDGSVEMVEYEY